MDGMFVLIWLITYFPIVGESYQSSSYAVFDTTTAAKSFADGLRGGNDIYAANAMFDIYKMERVKSWNERTQKRLP